MNENNILNVLKQCFTKIIPTEDARTTITPMEFAINLVFCYLGDSKTFSLESIRRSMMGHLNKTIKIDRGTAIRDSCFESIDVDVTMKAAIRADSE